MNYKKLINDLSKEYTKAVIDDKKNDKLRVGKAIMDDGTNVHGVTFDGYEMYFVPDRMWIFDDEKLPNVLMDLAPFITNRGDELAFLSDQIIVDHGCNYNVFTDGSDNPIYVDSKLITKYVDVTKCKFYGNGGFSPVHICEDGCFVGLVMPSRLQRGSY